MLQKSFWWPGGQRTYVGNLDREQQRSLFDVERISEAGETSSVSSWSSEGAFTSVQRKDTKLQVDAIRMAPVLNTQPPHILQEHSIWHASKDWQMPSSDEWMPPPTRTSWPSAGSQPRTCPLPQEAWIWPEPVSMLYQHIKNAHDSESPF
jgi:hypothetical protein